MLSGDGYVTTFLFRVRAGQVPQVSDALKKEWRSATGNYPFEYTFLDDQLSGMYKAEVRWEKTIQASCFFALFIGVYGSVRTFGDKCG